MDRERSDRVLEYDRFSRDRLASSSSLGLPDRDLLPGLPVRIDNSWCAALVSGEAARSASSLLSSPSTLRRFDGGSAGAVSTAGEALGLAMVCVVLLVELPVSDCDWCGRRWCGDQIGLEELSRSPHQVQSSENLFTNMFIYTSTQVFASMVLDDDNDDVCKAATSSAPLHRQRASTLQACQAPWERKLRLCVSDSLCV